MQCQPCLRLGLPRSSQCPPPWLTLLPKRARTHADYVHFGLLATRKVEDGQLSSEGQRFRHFTCEAKFAISHVKPKCGVLTDHLQFVSADVCN